MRNRTRILNRKRVRNLIATFVVTVSICFVIQNVRGWRAEAARLAKVHATEGLLDRPFRLSLVRQFDDMLQAVHRLSGLDIVVRWDLIEKQGITHDVMVGVRGGDRSLGGFLHVLLGNVCASAGHYSKLNFYVDSMGQVVITTYDDAIGRVGSVRVYDIGGLNVPEQDLALLHRKLLWLVMDCEYEDGKWVEDSDTRNPVGAWCSPQAKLQFRKRDRWLVVYDTEDAHRRIQRLLQRIHDDPALLSRLNFHAPEKLY
jgi:hypothetical protein